MFGRDPVAEGGAAVWPEPLGPADSILEEVSCVVSRGISSFMGFPLAGAGCLLSSLVFRLSLLSVAKVISVLRLSRDLLADLDTGEPNDISETFLTLVEAGTFSAGPFMSGD